MEEWKEIPNFEKYYSISNYGRLKSFKEKAEGKILKNINKKGGYFSVVLRANGKVRYTRIHRLVAEAFLPNFNAQLEVNHIDGNKQNNHVKNLEWCTRKQNVQHAILINPGFLNGMKQYNQIIRPKSIWQLTLAGEKLNLFPNSVEAGKQTGVCQRNILQVCSKDEFSPGRVRKQAGGYRWEFEKC